MATGRSRTAAGIGGFVVLAAAITTTVLVVGGSTPAAAADLARFESCAAMEAWVEDVAVNRDEPFVDVAGGVAESGDEAVAAAPTAAGAGGLAADRTATASADVDQSGGTNTVVEGVDEIDIVDRLDGGRALVARNGALALVDLAGPTLLARVDGLPQDARISVGGDVVWVAGTAVDGSGVSVSRLRLGGDELTTDGEWRSPGWLVDARRTGDRLHVVAVDQPAGPGILPFEGGPVPCDAVWFPQAGADTPAATLLATLPAEGELAPVAAAEVAGSAAGFHVTGDAAYVTTQTWDQTPATGVHRFDLATLTPTGSGSVPGVLPGPFGISEYEGYLRVATTEQGVGFAMPADAPAVAEADRAAPPAEQDGALAEVFVLDLDGNLDIVGRTGRFGHAGETIHGVRFVGDTAYVVTFLQTDPFWVIDLADPAAPSVVGALEIPGFSAYLHPIDEGRVVGFGPDGSGRIAARLFDVTDPAAPAVVDELVLGDDSAVAWDYHAFVALGDTTFAVPVSNYPEVVEERCVPVEPVPLPEPQPLPVDPGIGGGSTASPGVDPAAPVQSCEPIFSGGSTGVAVLGVDGDSLTLVDERTIPSDGSFTAERVLPTPDGGWVLVGWDRLVDPDGGELVL